MIRNATKEDLKEIALVHKECFPNSFSTHLTKGKKLLQKFYLEYLNVVPELFFVDVEDNKIVGFCMGYYPENNNFQKSFLKQNWFMVAIRTLLGLIRFDKIIYKKVFYKKKNSNLIKYDENYYLIDRKLKSDLLSICVKPEYRKHGISTELFKNFELQSITNQRKFIQLAVEKTNNVALAFYKKIGFSELALNDNQLVLVKELR